MIRRPPRSTRTDTLFPYTTLFRSLDAILDFTFLRALREVPRIIPFDPVARSVGAAFPVALSEEDSEASDIAVAIFDGGLPANHGLDQWVTLHDAPGVGRPIAAGKARSEEHTSELQTLMRISYAVFHLKKTTH